MSYLFQKLQATSTHAEDLLTPKDRAFCENLFNAYKTHQEHYKNLLHSAKRSGAGLVHLAHDRLFAGIL